ncbi:MAG TPA: D-alanyl-D-alanine carboxypeptidase family protein [Candidatus Saccharimonadales bacterium]|jgi:D-alanyl-D-alanine carboxypeptidase
MSETQKSTGEFDVSEQDKKLVESLLSKVDEARKSNDLITVIERDDLPSLLSTEEISIVDRVYDIDPTIYGFKAPKLSIESVPHKLIKVEPQPYGYKGKDYFTNVQYIPETPYHAYQSMAEAIKDELGRELLIESSYRSNAYQAITFLSILKLNDFDVAKTARRAAIPGYSEHGTPSQLALDLQNIDGLPSDETPEDFEGTEEYDWLIANANNFNFFMSYPKDNSYGLMFEPWHWRHKPTGNS